MLTGVDVIAVLVTAEATTADVAMRPTTVSPAIPILSELPFAANGVDGTGEM